MSPKWPNGKWISPSRWDEKQFCSVICRNKHGPKGTGAGREARRGVLHWSAKLTEDQVRAIRKDTRPGKKVAHEYGIGKTTFYRIKRRELWAHVKD
jgi:hypothetical protein